MQTLTEDTRFLKNQVYQSKLFGKHCDLLYSHVDEAYKDQVIKDLIGYLYC